MSATDDYTESRRTLTICNAKGLHARAASKLVKLADSFTAEIWVMRADMVVTASSIMGLMMLGAAEGQDIEVWARGTDAPAAIEAIAALVAEKFEEDA